jgi:osmotically-inducible protein OsmY
MISRRVVALLLATVIVSACHSERRTTVGLDVDLFLNPSSSDLTDVLLQTGIAKRLSEDKETQGGVIHVRVVNGMVVLSGAVRSSEMKAKAETIAKETVVKLNETSIQTTTPVTNRIDVQR